MNDDIPDSVAPADEGWEDAHAAAFDWVRRALSAGILHDATLRLAAGYHGVVATVWPAGGDWPDREGGLILMHALGIPETRTKFTRTEDPGFVRYEGTVDLPGGWLRVDVQARSGE